MTNLSESLDRGDEDFEVLIFGDAAFEIVHVKKETEAGALFGPKTRQEMLERLPLLKKGRYSVIFEGHDGFFYSRQDLYNASDFGEQLLITLDMAGLLLSRDVSHPSAS